MGARWPLLLNKWFWIIFSCVYTGKDKDQFLIRFLICKSFSVLMIRLQCIFCNQFWVIFLLFTLSVFSDFLSSFEIFTPSFSISKGLFVGLLFEVWQHTPCITNSLLKILSFRINFYHLFYLFSEKKETVSYLQKYKKELLKIL